MKHLKLCLIAVAAIAASTFAQAEQKAMKSDVTIASDINYLLYTPKDYASSDKTYPLVVWLHGGDQGGGDIEKLRRSGLPKMIEEGRDFPFLVFSPQNPSEDLLYPIERVASVVQAVVADHRVDRERIYLIGYSREGSAHGRWPRNSPKLLPRLSRSPAAVSGITSIERMKGQPSGPFMAQMTL
ncbi:putative peptidase [Agrobacterium tumefaciens]|uniref:Peptidase n=1 Tax=Agrobacterium tumefaciens TaxID=358 RepID=A0AAW8LXZ4_AGRTU|nr:putative peptidase [Agrobacterium tumefaciens]MDR6703719.1 putative peptidase [Agrobacterium tumefaciens]